MPGLYGLSSNANVSVYNTTGLYQLSNANVIVGNVNAGNTTGLYTAQGNVFVPTNAQALFNLLSESGNVQFALTNNNSQILAYDLINTNLYNFYSNANVAGYLPHYGGTINSYTIFNGSGLAIQGPDYAQLQWTNGQAVPASEYDVGTGSWFFLDAGGGTFQSNSTGTLKTITLGNDGSLTAQANVNAKYINTTNGIFWSGNGQAYSSGSTYSNVNVAAYIPTDPTITNIQANIGAYETWANATIQSTNANLGAFETYANANAATQATSINTINANLGAFETYANATIQSTNANLGAFETYANATFGTSSYGNSNVATYLPTDPTIYGIQANLGAYQIYANANAGIQALSITSLFSTASSQATSINTINANLGAFETYANAHFGTSNYSNVNVAAYIPTDPTITTIQANIGGSEIYANATFATKTALQILDANVGAFETYANAHFGTSNYSNVNVAAYIPTDPTITGIQANIGAFEIYANANAASQQTQINTLQGQVYTNSNVTNLLSGGTYTGDIIATTGVVNAAAINSSGQLTAGTYLQANNGLYSLSSITEAYTDGIVVDYTTGNGRISVGSADAVTFYSGGPGVTTTLVLYPNGNIVHPGSVTAANLITTNGVFWANGVAYSSGGSTYGNTQVAAYLPTDPTIYGIQANIGAFETYANVTFATKTALQTLDANVGAYEIATNANLGTATTNITTLFANAATQAVSLNTINANLGAFETYANATFGTSSYGNSNVAAYLPVYGGNISANNITVTGNLYSNTGNPIVFGQVNAFANTVVLSGDVNVNNTTADILSFTIPSAGIWKITYIARGQILLTATGSGQNYINTFITDNSNTPVVNSNVTIISASGFGFGELLQNTGTGVIEITTNGSATYKLRATSQVSGTGGGSFYILSNTTSVLYEQLNPEFAISNVAYTGNISYAGNITSNGSIFTANGIYWLGNGAAYSSGSDTYGNTQVAAYLPVYGGNIAANIITGINTTKIEATGTASALQLYSYGASNPTIQITAGQTGINATSQVSISAQGIQIGGIGGNSFVNTFSIVDMSPNITRGNLTVGNGGGAYGAVGFVNVTSGINSSGPVNTTANINTTQYFTGNGYYLTGMTVGTYGNTQVAAFNQGTILNPFLLSGM